MQKVDAPTLRGPNTIKMQKTAVSALTIATTATTATIATIATVLSTAFADFLHKKSQDLIKENDTEVVAAAERGDKVLIAKIESFRHDKLTDEERVENTVDSILQRIKVDPFTRAQFRKDPTRQTLHEKAQIEWIQNNQYSDAVKMNAGMNGTCLANKKIHVISTTNPRPTDATKTFDAFVPSKNMYIVLKHTGCPGGAQDNQYADVKNFIRQEVVYLTENVGASESFAAYLDGAYYTPKKIKELEDMIPSSLKSKILITSCASIPSKIA